MISTAKFSIRKAHLKDIDAIYSILLPHSKDGAILRRTKEDIEKNIENFTVAEIENTIAGVVSYYNYSNNLKEVRSLAVIKRYYMNGIGAALINKLIKSILKNFPKAKIFALSNVPDFFKKSNFIEVSKDSLPEKIWKDCSKCEHQNSCNETALVYSKT